jgi:hypothetical protein
MLNQLTHIRRQLVMQQSLINESLGTIDALIISQMGKSGNEAIKISQQSNNNLVISKGFPEEISSKRDKLLYILREASRPITAKDVKRELLGYGDVLLNVDQSLVNLEKDRRIFSRRDDGKKKYFLKNNL